MLFTVQRKISYVFLRGKLQNDFADSLEPKRRNSNVVRAIKSDCTKKIKKFTQNCPSAPRNIAWSDNTVRVILSADMLYETPNMNESPLTKKRG